jgi:hypothetical protein
MPGGMPIYFNCPQYQVALPTLLIALNTSWWHANTLIALNIWLHANT